MDRVIPHDYRLVLVPPDSEYRCTFMTARGQCLFARVPGHDKCEKHIRKGQLAKLDRMKYKLNKYLQRVEELGEGDDVLNLRQELGILRMTLEELLMRCEREEGEFQLLLQVSNISDLAMKIERLVMQCAKLESMSENVLREQDIIRIANKFIAVVQDFIPDDQMPEVVKRLESVVEDPYETTGTPAMDSIEDGSET